MGKVSYANLKLKTDKTMKTFKFMDQEIEVLQYLPIENKYDLIMISLQKSEEHGFFNPIKLDMYFHLNLIYLYTNLSFTDKQKENETKLYDTLVSNHFLELFLEAMNETEYADLYGYMEELVETISKYRLSITSLVQSFIDDLPVNAEAALKIMNNFDPEQFNFVMNFAKAANGGRDFLNMEKQKLFGDISEVSVQE